MLGTESGKDNLYGVSIVSSAHSQNNLLTLLALGLVLRDLRSPTTNMKPRSVNKELVIVDHFNTICTYIT